MKTTVNLPDALAEQAKQRAADEGRTFTSLIEEGLRSVLATPRAVPSDEPLPSFGGVGAKPKVDLEDREALWEALDRDGIR